MKRNTSNIVVGIVLLGLGFLGWKVFGKKKIKKHVETPETQEEIASKTEIVNDSTDQNTSTENIKPQEEDKYKLPAGSFSTAEKLVFEIICLLLKYEDFKTPDEFLEKLVNGCGRYVEDFEWYNEIPKNINEAEEVLKDLSLYERYKAILFNSYSA